MTSVGPPRVQRTACTAAFAGRHVQAQKIQSTITEDNGNEANPRSRPKISKTRVIPTGVTEAIIAFDPTSEELDEIKLRITPAGGERDKEDPIRIIDATVHSPDTQEVTVKDGVLSLVPDTSERIQLKIVTDAEIRGYALKMRLMK